MAGIASKQFSAIHHFFKVLSEGKSFDRLLNKVKIVDMQPGRVTAQFVVEEDNTNVHGTLHGGYTAFLVDAVTTVALLTTEPAVPGVTLDLSVAYTKAAKLGETVTVEAVTLKKGSKVTLSTADFKNADGMLLAHGRHSKYVG